MTQTQYMVNSPAGENRVSSIQEAADFLGPLGQSRQVSRIMTTPSGGFAGLRPISATEQTEFVNAIK